MRKVKMKLGVVIACLGLFVAESHAVLSCRLECSPKAAYLWIENLKSLIDRDPTEYSGLNLKERTFKYNLSRGKTRGEPVFTDEDNETFEDAAKNYINKNYVAEYYPGVQNSSFLLTYVNNVKKLKTCAADSACKGFSDAVADKKKSLKSKIATQSIKRPGSVDATDVCLLGVLEQFLPTY